MEDGLFRKIMTYVGGGAKAIKYFCFGPEYEFPVRPETLSRLHPQMTVPSVLVLALIHHMHGLPGQLLL